MTVPLKSLEDSSHRPKASYKSAHRTGNKADKRKEKAQQAYRSRCILGEASSKRILSFHNRLMENAEKT